MIGILCEKASAARNFAKALGGSSGNYNGEDYIIVAARGHLYGMIDDASKQVPEDKEKQYKNWNPNLLPWDEKDFAWKYEKKPGVNDVIKEIQKGMKGVDEICIATDDDPSGEGELLAWEVIYYGKLKAKKYTRMYFTDEAPASIQKAFKERKLLGTDLSCMEEDPDYRQALFRTKWDYLSMQWTRLAAAYGSRGQVPRQGRLKSAMVKLVGDQLALCDAYVKKPFYQNRFQDENGVVYTNKDEPTFEKKEDVPAVYEESDVVLDSKENKSSIPPRFLDLASLSSSLASRGVGSKTVLSTYQKMYEAQVVSYPRTEDRTITKEQFNELLPLASKIAEVVGVDSSLLTHTKPRYTHVKDGGAHGANRPGPNVPDSLEELDGKYGRGAAKIYETLAKNYLATLAEDYRYEQQKGHVEKYPKFVGVSNVPVYAGWKAVYGDVMADEDSEESTKGIGTHAKPFVYEGANKKPTPPTMKWLMKQLEKYNVGTGATRTSTYADVTSASAKFPLLKDTRGKITMAECGKISYALLPGTHISDLKMTERVFGQMKEVAEGTADPDACLHEIRQMIIDDRETMKANGMKYREENQKEKAAGIFNGEEISFNREFGGYRFTDEEVEALLKGEEITVHAGEGKKAYSAKGHLAKQTYRGKEFYGFQADSFENEGNNGETTQKEKYTGMFEGKEISFSRTWGGYTFSDEECEKLLAGEELTLHGLTSKKGSTYGVRGKLELQNFRGKNFYGFKKIEFLKEGNDQEEKKASKSTEKKAVKTESAAEEKEKYTGMFKGKEVTFSRVWGGYRFSDEECEALLAGDEITLNDLQSKSGKTYGVVGKLAQQTFRGKKFYGFKKVSYTD